MESVHVLRWRKRATQSVHVFCRVGNFNSFIFVENLKFYQVSISKCFKKIITFQLILKYLIQTYYIIGRHFNILVEILYLV